MTVSFWGPISTKIASGDDSAYRWKASFVQAGTRGLSGTDASDREKQLEHENRRLKEMVADLALANEILKKGRTRT